MFIKRIAFLVVGIGCTLLGHAGTEELVTIGKYRAHESRILAKFKDEISAQRPSVALQSLGLRVSRHYPLVGGLVLLDSTTSRLETANVAAGERSRALLERIRTLRESGEFAYVEPDYAHFPSVEPTDSKYADGTLWGLRNNGQNGGLEGADINVARAGADGTNAWDITVGTTNTVVAVIDTGVRYTHVDLARQMWSNPGEIPGNGIDDDGNGYIDDVHGINSILDSGDPFDDGDHGSHVAGTIAASANDENGHVGVAWNVRIMALKFLRGPDQGGFGLTSDAIQCLQYAVSKGVKLSNNSWGGGPFEQTMLDALQQARDRGHLFIAAAGNNTQDADLDPGFPASYDLDNVVSVAALDRKDKLASFSNYGRTSVDLGAPGVEIFSSTSGSDTEYQVFAGTSMASPHVAGVAALCLSAFPKASMIELRERLLSTVTVVEGLRGKVVTGGRLNALGALKATADGILEVSVTPAPGSAAQPAELLAGSRSLFTARVSDLLSVTNARFAGFLINGVSTTNLVIANDGRVPDLVSNDSVYTGYLFVPTNLGPMELVYDVTATGKKKTTITNHYAIVPGPANDMLANAAKVTASGGSVTGNNKFGTLEPREPMHADNPGVSASVWWDWSPRATGTVVVDTTGTTFDSVVAVYTGTTMANLKKIASADDVGTRKQAYVSFPATNGVTYHIAVSGFDTNSVGLIRLRVEPNGAADTTAPTVRITTPTSGLIVSQASVLISGVALDPTPNSSGLQKIAVRVNNNLAFDATGTTSWGQVVPLTRGLNTVSAIAIDHAGNVSTPSVITLNYRPDEVPNDLFARSSVLAGVGGSVTATNTAAGKEFGEPNHGGNEGGRSVWWSWVAPANGILKLSTKDSNFDTLLGVYTGNRLDRLVTIASNDDSIDGSGYSEISQAVKQGESYLIAVDGFAGRSGSVKLSYAFEAKAIYYVTVNATAGGAVTPGSGFYASGAKLEFVATANSGFEFVKWEGTLSSFDPVLSVNVNRDINLTPSFRARKISEDFQSGQLGGLGWKLDPSAPWTVVQGKTSTTDYVLRSAPIGNGQTSAISLTIEAREGTGSFDYSISSEPAWDKLQFLVDGSEVGSWSGSVDWSTKKFSLTAGTHVLEWRYSKDLNNSLGDDAAYIDNLDLPLAIKADSASKATLSLERKGNGSFSIAVVGQLGQTYVLEASEDLIRWTKVSEGIASNGVLLVNDADSVALRARYYRAVVKP